MMIDKTGRARQRLVGREFGTSEIAREALDVARADRAGNVGGVLVDFRHDNIPAGEWEARPFWHVWGSGEDRSGFIFPGEASSPLEELLEVHDDMAGLPVLYAEPGDRLVVESVVDRISDRRFDHRHDATIKLASLLLTKANGEEVRPPSPMAFYGSTQLREGPAWDAYDRLIERIFGENGNPDPQAFEHLPPAEPGMLRGGYHPLRDLDLSQRAVLHAGNAERALGKLMAKISAVPDARVHLLEFARQTALAGFFQAKHESNPAEEKMARVIGGGDSARRRPKAKDNRLRYAQDLINENPNIRMGRLARGVIEKIFWNDDREMISEKAMSESLERSIVRGDLVVATDSPLHPHRRG